MIRFNNVIDFFYSCFQFIALIVLEILVVKLNLFESIQILQLWTICAKYNFLACANRPPGKQQKALYERQYKTKDLIFSLFLTTVLAVPCQIKQRMNEDKAIYQNFNTFNIYTTLSSAIFFRCEQRMETIENQLVNIQNGFIMVQQL